jgi:acetoin utilization deacetylase AcuC-like enzyme
MAIFYHDPTVFFASIHGDPEHDYPFNAGFAEQIGGPKALGTTFNIPLPGGADWWDYKAALMRVVRCVREFGAQALVVSLGLDTLKGDPVAFPKSRFSILPEDCAEMGRILLDGLELPTVVVQEGGYELGLVPDGVAAFLTGNVHGPKL